MPVEVSLSESLAFLPQKYRSTVRLEAHGLVVAYEGRWEHADWEHFLAEVVAATGLDDLASDPAQQDALGAYLEELKALYNKEGPEAFSKLTEEARKAAFKQGRAPTLFSAVSSTALGFAKSFLGWLRHLWAAELKAENLPRGIPLAVRGLLGTLFPVIKLKYVLVLIAVIFVGGWGINALRYRAAVKALNARQS